MLWQNTWKKQLKDKRTYSSSGFERIQPGRKACCLEQLRVGMVGACSCLIWVDQEAESRLESGLDYTPQGLSLSDTFLTAQRQFSKFPKTTPPAGGQVSQHRRPRIDYFIQIRTVLILKVFTIIISNLWRRTLRLRESHLLK